VPRCQSLSRGSVQRWATSSSFDCNLASRAAICRCRFCNCWSCAASRPFCCSLRSRISAACASILPACAALIRCCRCTSLSSIGASSSQRTPWKHVAIHNTLPSLGIRQLGDDDPESGWTGCVVRELTTSSKGFKTDAALAARRLRARRVSAVEDFSASSVGRCPPQYGLPLLE